MESFLSRTLFSIAVEGTEPTDDVCKMWLGRVEMWLELKAKVVRLHWAVYNIGAAGCGGRGESQERATRSDGGG